MFFADSFIFCGCRLWLEVAKVTQACTIVIQWLHVATSLLARVSVGKFNHELLRGRCKHFDAPRPAFVGFLIFNCKEVTRISQQLPSATWSHPLRWLGMVVGQTLVNFFGGFSNIQLIQVYFSISVGFEFVHQQYFSKCFCFFYRLPRIFQNPQQLKSRSKVNRTVLETEPTEQERRLMQH